MSFFSKKPRPAAIVERKVHGKAVSEWDYILDIKEDTLIVWCLTEGNPVRIPDEDVGYFFSDEIFLVVKTFLKNGKIEHNIHFWIGEDKSDEIKRSPQKQVEQLMSVLDDNAVLFREIEGHESPQFKQYFKVFGVHKGSLKDVFNPDHPEGFKPKLLHFHLNKRHHRMEMYEVPISWKSLTSNDVFIYDEGTKITQWNGRKCDEEERLAARQYIHSALKRRKGKATSEFYDEEDLFEKNDLHTKLGDANITPKHFKQDKKGFNKTMLRLSDESGKLILTKVYSGKIYRDGINPDDVTFVEDIDVIYIYIGPGASKNEGLSAWNEAIKYLKSVDRPDKSIAVFTAGSYLPAFYEIWNDSQIMSSRPDA